MEMLEWKSTFHHCSVVKVDKWFASSRSQRGNQFAATMQSIRLKSTVGTIGTYDCGGQGSRARFSSDVDCSLKQEVQFVRMDKSNSLEFGSDRL